jgi:uncharacterized coiled-coil DUF342 family protein
MKNNVAQMQKKINSLVTKDEYNVTVNDVRLLKSNMTEALGDIESLWKAFNKLKDKVDGMQFPTVEEVNLLRNRVDKLENQLIALKKVYGDLEKKLKGMRTGGGGADQELVERALDELAKLRAEFEAHRDQANNNLDRLNQEMPTKADK